ncbi:F-box domain, Leucine-rich repeat domain, L domain-like protein [Artemisia annua]|uniref:F-box domain, Leucine-rich repeat domain, L domain-like protein n=1 Tax=Artemisia annua TaxID=35608 RepID=A0A2U1KSN6_ARTAN|nr:F-box domain, Leucine-rich repeat domain, L domain-like protein [Artemisia annua]
MLLADIEEKGLTLTADEHDFLIDTDDEGEIPETNMVFMATLEKDDAYEVSVEEATPSYNTDAENNDAFINRLLNGDIPTTSQVNDINIFSITPTNDFESRKEVGRTDVGHRHRTRVNVKGDRLSSLPDDVIHRILSLICTKHAIRTSVLSSKWRFMWTLMPCLDFSRRDGLTICHPQLSNLTLENGDWSSEVVNVDAPQLKNLTITKSYGKYLINAPQLVNLLFKGYSPLLYSANGFHFLEKAHACIYYLNYTYAPKFAPSVISLLQQLCHVKFLTLNMELVEVVTDHGKQHAAFCASEQKPQHQSPFQVAVHGGLQIPHLFYS